jgi:aldehyde:ferredoxin oxidoreductase
MANGYTGQILRLDLTTQTTSTIQTKKYEAWGGGNGIGTAIFWELCRDKAIPGTDPRNVLCLMTSPLCGTVAPSTGRTEIVGIGLQAYPFDWFTRSNLAGRFGAMLKAAGWDGVVIEGRASALCWVKIVNDKVTFEDAKNLKGLDCWETQMDVWSGVSGNRRYGEWLPLEKGYTTQRPAVLCIGPAGEHGSRAAAIVHDAGDASGQCGFGGVWGAKNLKALAVLGTGSVEVADPNALMDTRLWMKGAIKPVNAGPAVNPTFRAAGCVGCATPCRQRSATNNDSQCIETYWYASRSGIAKFPAPQAKRATDLVQRHGINAAEAMGAHQYLKALYQDGVLGAGKPINSAPLAMESYGSLGFAEEYLRAIASGEGIGADLAEGAMRAAAKWGRLEQDLDSGILNFPQWGYFWHLGLPGVEWAFGSLVTDRDVNEHTFQKTFGWLAADKALRERYPAEKFVELMAEKLVTFEGDPFMMDYGEGPTGIYSEHKAKLIAWDRHYGRFWKQSAMFCDRCQLYPSWIENQRTKQGLTPDVEPRLYNAVTGTNLSFADGMTIGRRILNLTRAIWALQGRHRDQEQFANFMHKTGAAYGGCGTTKTRIEVVNPAPTGGVYPVYDHGAWRYDELKEMVLNRAGVEAFKTHYYTVEEWDPATGQPRRSTLETLGLKYVADELAAKGKLGVEATSKSA